MRRKSCIDSLSYGDVLGEFGVKFVAPNPFVVTGVKPAFFLCPKCNKAFSAIPSDISRGRIKSCCFFGRGERDKRLYKIWQGIKERTINSNSPGYKNYGNRGITVCQDWLDFHTFQKWSLNNGYQNNLTIDRKNNDLGYSPENCHWVTQHTQARNRRSNVWWVFDGERMCTTDAAKKLQVLRSRLYNYTLGTCRIPESIANRVESIIQDGEDILPKLIRRPSDFNTGKPCP